MENLENLRMNFINMKRHPLRGYVQNISRTWRVSQKCGDYHLKTFEGKWYVSFVLIFEMP